MDYICVCINLSISNKQVYLYVHTYHKSYLGIDVYKIVLIKFTYMAVTFYIIQTKPLFDFLLYFLKMTESTLHLDFLFLSLLKKKVWKRLGKDLEKAMAPHSRTLAWKIPWTEEPGGLQSMGSRRVRHNWATSLSLFTFMYWRRKWQPTPVFLPGESQGWGRTESDMTEVT